MMNSLLSLNNFLYLANAGIPLFTQSLFYQFYLLIPIIVIEAYTHTQILKISIAKAIYISSVTNIFSTVVGGVLIVFLGAFAGEILFQTSVPVQPGDFPFLPLEIIVTLIPMFFISVLIESLLVIFRLKGIEKNKVKQSFLVANAFTYFMLVILAVTQLIKGYLEGRG